MDPIEESVRRAVEGGRPADHAFRQSIYAASTRAVERTIATRGLGTTEADAERSRLAGVLERVEAEYSAYYGGEGVGGASVHGHEADESHAAEPAHRPEPEPVPARTKAPAAFEPRRAVAQPATEGADKGWTPGAGRGAAPAAGRRRPSRNVLLALLFIVFLALAAWVFLSPGGAPVSPEASAPPSTTQAGTTQAGTARPANALAWIDVFAGADLERVSTPGGGRVAAVGGPERPALRMAGPQGAEGEEILLDLGPGLVGEIAGSNVRVELVAGSPDGAMREFSVRCLFGQESVCERQRFATSMPEEAFVFDVQIPDGVSTPASIALGPGLSAEGADVDLYSVRMRIL